MGVVSGQEHLHCPGSEQCLFYLQEEAGEAGKDGETEEGRERRREGEKEGGRSPIMVTLKDLPSNHVQKALCAERSKQSMVSSKD